APLRARCLCSVRASPASMCPALFFFSATATTALYTLSLHDALPIYASLRAARRSQPAAFALARFRRHTRQPAPHDDSGARRCLRSEEHTSELQSRRDLVCRLLLEKKKKNPRKRERPSSWWMAPQRSR